jgi:hypothetical protein
MTKKLLRQKGRAKSVSSGLSHHSQTGKVLPRSKTSYPAIAFLLLCVGVLLGGLTAGVHAAYLSAAAEVYSPPPAIPAVITSPSPSSHFSNMPITVKGNCPDFTLVKLYKNNTFSGSAMCDETGHFQILTDLLYGKNNLVARDYNSINLAGPNSPTVAAYYDTLAPPDAYGQLVLHSENYFKGYVPGEIINWPVEILGGQSPYAVSVDWGDGNNDLVSLAGPGKFNLQHAYSKHGGYRGAYTVIIKASDTASRSAYLQMTAIINDPNVVAATTANNDGPAQNLLFLQQLWHKLMLSWPVYGVLILMATSFWLGERQEKWTLLRPVRRHRHA